MATPFTPRYIDNEHLLEVIQATVDAATYSYSMLLPDDVECVRICRICDEVDSHHEQCPVVALQAILAIPGNDIF